MNELSIRALTTGTPCVFSESGSSLARRVGQNVAPTLVRGIA